MRGRTARAIRIRATEAQLDAQEAGIRAARQRDAEGLAVANLHAAQARHSALIVAKCAAAGVAVCSAAADRALADDLDIARAHADLLAVERDFALVFGEKLDAARLADDLACARREITRIEEATTLADVLARVGWTTEPAKTPGRKIVRDERGAVVGPCALHASDVWAELRRRGLWGAP